MEAQGHAKSKAKRQCDDDDNEQRKSQRLASSAETERKTKIIDLNDDCLMKVFGYLDLQCLFHVAIANEWLRPAARNVYARKFGTKMVQISGCDDFRSNTRPNAQNAQSEASVLTEHNRHNQISVTGLKTCLLYLRCFGPGINELCIDYNYSKSKRYNHVHQYINDYCAATLTRISFYQMPNITIEPFQKAFVRVEDVEIWNCLLDVQWNTFVECFPNLRRLKIQYINMVRSGGLMKPFEHLEHLEIVGCNEAVTKQLAADLLPGVHRLKSLEIKSIYEEGPKEPIAALLDMIRMHPQITELAYNFRSYGHILVRSVDVQRIVAEHAALIELRLEDYEFAVADVYSLISQFNSLKVFRFQVNGWMEYATFEAQLDHTKWEVIDLDLDLSDYYVITLIRKNVE